MIDILIPVLGRPERAKPVHQSIWHNSALPRTVIFLCSRGDEAEIEACKQTGAIVHLIDGGDHEYARKINAGCLLDFTKNQWVFLGADDLDFHPRWDMAAMQVYADTGKRVIGTNDLCNPTVMRGLHSTHSLVHKSYVEDGTIDEPGKLLHEGYHHNYCDTEFIETARMRGEWAFSPDSYVEHLHWICGKGEKQDSIYEKGQKDYHSDGRLYATRRKLWR